MIHELRTYTLKPGAAPMVARNSGEVGRDIRGDDYGRLEGYWITELGPLNQVMHLWSYDSLDERQRLREALAKNDRWVNEYLPLIRPVLLRQDIRLMHPNAADPATRVRGQRLRVPQLPGRAGQGPGVAGALRRSNAGT